MATATDVERFAAASSDISTLARRETSTLWRSLDVAAPMAVREALEDVLPQLVTAYGETSVTVAADFYDDLRDRSTAPGRFRATPAEPVDVEAVRANARWAIGPIFSATPDPAAALGRLELEVDRMVLQPGRDTIGLSVERDPADARWARIPRSDEPCAFCRMLASRGAEYASREAAGWGNDYHADCRCVPTPIWEGDPYPDGYQPDVLYEQYLEARDAAGTGDPKAILSKLRELQGIN